MTFMFERNGIEFRVSTEVGEGRLTDVVVLEDEKAEVELEQSE